MNFVSEKRGKKNTNGGHQKHWEWKKFTSDVFSRVEDEYGAENKRSGGEDWSVRIKWLLWFQSTQTVSKQWFEFMDCLANE